MNGGQRRQILLLRRQAGGSLTEGASEYQPEETAYQVRRSRLIQTATTTRQPTVKVREMAGMKVVMKATPMAVQTAMTVMMDQVEFRGNQVAREHEKWWITTRGQVLRWEVKTELRGTRTMAMMKKKRMTKNKMTKERRTMTIKKAMGMTKTRKMMGKGSRMKMMRMTAEVATVVQAAMLAPIGTGIPQLKMQAAMMMNNARCNF